VAPRDLNVKSLRASQRGASGVVVLNCCIGRMTMTGLLLSAQVKLVKVNTRWRYEYHPITDRRGSAQWRLGVN